MSSDPPAPSAISHVFTIPELLEIILLHLNTKDLLLSQRVSRNFRHTTQGSIRLRRKLFLEPDWTLEGRPYDEYSAHNRPGPKPENNRLLHHAFPFRYPTVTLVIVSDGSQNGQTELATGRNEGNHWSWDVCISFPADRVPHTKACVAYPEASWRSMFLSQPPCQSLYLVRRWQRSLRPAVVREGGITMGDFFDEATRDVPGCGDQKWHPSYISSDRDWHFEGKIQCSSVTEEDSIASERRDTSLSEEWLQKYTYSRTLLDGRIRAFSDD